MLFGIIALQEGMPDLEQELNQLESDLSDAIVKKQTDKTLIDEYRQKQQEMHTWLDTLIKRMDILDKGSGMTCPQKLVTIFEIKKEFESEGPSRLQNIKQLANNVIDVVSNLDSQQVEEQLKSIERRYGEMSKRLERKSQVLEMANKGIEGVKDEIEQTRLWVVQKDQELQNPAPIGFDSKAAEDYRQTLKSTLKDAEIKNVLLDSIEKKISNMQNELEPVEQSQLESSLRNVQTDLKNLIIKLKSEVDTANTAVESRKKLEFDVENARSWIKARTSEVRKLGGYLPLKAIVIDKEIQQSKAHEQDINNFNATTLNDLFKLGNSIIRECSEPDKKRLQDLLNTVSEEYDALKREHQARLHSLTDLLQNRKNFEADVEKCQHWLNEAEVATSGDIRTSSIELLEEQLAKYSKLFDEADNMSHQLDGMTEQGKSILGTISDPDKLALTELLKNLKDKHGRLYAIIKDRANLLKDNIKEKQDVTAKVAENVEFMNEIRKELSELNKPIGNKIEDVQGILHSYEKILSDLKSNKAKLGDLSSSKNPELQSILQQQDDLIRAVEDQIARLRQLLLLREQYLALINEIITFIMKYTTVITDIEKGGHTVEEKIKRYDDVIVKIQECEATLSSATDKGRQIAEEGTAADRNAITEQLQSLKQQLQNLRRAMEKQRQQHEVAAAEHKKAASELSSILDWLHENEATVRSRPLLERDVGSVDREIKAHKDLDKKVREHLASARRISDSLKHDDGMPGSLIEMLSEAQSLMDALPRELDERAEYLEKNRRTRGDYVELVEKLNAWVAEANIRLRTGEDGVDFENIGTDLEEHRIFFGNETNIRDLVSQKIQQAADKVWPSLGSVEQEELSREQQDHRQLLKNTLNSARSKQARLEQDAETWKDYKQVLERVRAALERSKVDEESVDTLAGVHYSAEKIIHVLNDLQVSFFLLIYNLFIKILSY